MFSFDRSDQDCSNARIYCQDRGIDDPEQPLIPPTPFERGEGVASAALGVVYAADSSVCQGSKLRFDAAGAHEAPATGGLVKGKYAESHQEDTSPAAPPGEQDTCDDQGDAPHRAHDASGPVNVPRKEVTHAHS